MNKSRRKMKLWAQACPHKTKDGKLAVSQINEIEGRQPAFYINKHGEKVMIPEVYCECYICKTKFSNAVKSKKQIKDAVDLLNDIFNQIKIFTNEKEDQETLDLMKKAVVDIEEMTNCYLEITNKNNNGNNNKKKRNKNRNSSSGVYYPR